LIADAQHRAATRQSATAVALSAFVAAMQTLTRVPLASASAPTAQALAWSAVFYPLVGLFLGAAGIVVYLLGLSFFPASVSSLLVLAVWILLTGALHEDGIADTFDAFGSQRSRDDILRVMKDSRIGVYGALALAVSLLLRWQALAALPDAEIVAAFVASQVFPRAGIVTLAFLAGPASGGTGGAFAAALRMKHIVFAWLLAAVLLAPLQEWREMMAVMAVSLVIVIAARRYFHRRLGGVTGDCLGAANQMQEIAGLLVILGLSGASH
jgi:adenosylcobinamide-GDP ribazoletransferase